ncbi:MAG: hypothetical protein A2086_10295 [Spirochaetes bacterium GWD1_27_9]|nr:MAG: hypothetical protein A2Z98_02260 [Spirochaetes bacterium GWB1_27_13]OHD23306.1 MAG: hypothetical protein A2Y34_11580 [Spirochaetes bacterium GWC1_27_15]OHD43187.1 MAG: hypothetical protein A2086_10295 [Spirochaetes bacterium GWD1_27_9]
MKKIIFLTLCLFILNLIGFSNEIKTSQTFSFASFSGLKFYNDNQSQKNSKINSEKEEKKNKFLYSMFYRSNDADTIISKKFFLSGWYTGSIVPSIILVAASVPVGFFISPLTALAFAAGCGLAVAAVGAIPFAGPIIVSLLFIGVGSAGIALYVPQFTAPLLAGGVLEVISIILEFYGFYLWWKKKGSIIQKVSFDIAPIFSEQKSSLYMGVRIKI